MRMYSRFSCLATCMFKPNLRMFGFDEHGKTVSEKISEWALMSRFIPISLRLDLHDMYKVIRGESVFKIGRVREYNETPVFDDYLKFVDEHEKLTSSLPFISKFSPNKFGIVNRNCLDIARLAAYENRKSGSIDDWEKWLDVVPFLLYNTISSTLTNNEFLILNSYVFENKTTNEIADEMKVSNPYVSKVLSKLKKMGLIIEPELVNEKI